MSLWRVILTRRRHHRGFTLIELSIALIIIGLIVGGVLVGQNLIASAEVRAQITQIEKYNSAVNTFRGKFNAIPGDMTPTTAQQFSFTVGSGCTGNQGQRDGNGLIDGFSSPSIYVENAGETIFFWSDISSAVAGNLIGGSFPTPGAQGINCGGPWPASSGTLVGQYYPAAKIGHGNYVYVYETSGANWFAVSAITSVTAGGVIISGANISVAQAYRMDAKIDDGNPLTGSVNATYITNANGNLSQSPNTTTSGGTSSSCYDTTTSTYSVTVNNGNGGNCALSFRFQ